MAWTFFDFIQLALTLLAFVGMLALGAWILSAGGSAGSKPFDPADRPLSYWMALTDGDLDGLPDEFEEDFLSTHHEGHLDL